MKLAIIFLILLSMCSCKKPSSVSASTNSDYEVSLLFKYDGCSVYRFTDDGSYRYFVKCENSSSTSRFINCGKGCIRNEKIDTVYTGRSKK